MKITKQNRRDAKQLFRNSYVNGVFDNARAMQTVSEVVTAKPRGYLGILEHFQRLIKLDETRRAAKVESAVPLTPDVESTFKSNLERKYGKGLQFSFVHNPALLGGVRVQVGSDVYDGSVAARLSSLKDSF